MRILLPLLLVCLVGLAVWRWFSDGDRIQTAPEGGAPSVQQPERRVVTTAPSQRIELGQARSGQTNPPEDIAVKLNRLYTLYLSSPNPGYSNVLAAVLPFSTLHPTATDLFKDACGFVAMRTGWERHIALAEEDRRTMIEWLIRNNPDPVARSNALANYERTGPTTIESIKKATRAMEEIFAQRFRDRYGLDGEAVTAALRELRLERPGPELWIRCDETVSPYPKVDSSRFPSIRVPRP